MLIAIEGADGCGKTTIARGLGDEIGGEVIHFPNDNNVTGPMIRRYLKKEWTVDYDGRVYDSRDSALAFQALQVTNRMESMPILRLAQGNPNSHVTLSRYWQSAWVYGQLDGLNPKFLEEIHVSMVQPDINILLDIPPEVAMNRRAMRDKDIPPERYEGQKVMVKNIVDLYRELWKKHCFDKSWITVDATMLVSKVFSDCAEIVKYAIRIAEPADKSEWKTAPGRDAHLFTISDGFSWCGIVTPDTESKWRLTKSRKGRCLICRNILNGRIKRRNK